MSRLPLIVDGHLDLSMNALEWNRDFRWSVADIRESEKGMKDKPDRSLGTISFDEMRRGNIGLCFATLIARYVKRGSTIPGWNSQEQAWAQTQGQLAWYDAMQDSGEMRRITNTRELEAHLSDWEQKHKTIGYVLTLEGADSLVNLKYLEKAYRYGLRAIGPAHYGPGVYANGTDSTEGLSRKGYELLTEMEKLGMILDATHLNDKCFMEALDHFQGPVWASHNNCRVFVNHNRQFTDEQIRELAGREAVIGVALDAWMLVENWDRGTSTPQSRNVTLELVVRNIDHICQLTGDSLCAAIGSDLDGAFGLEQSPNDIDTIADLQKIPKHLEAMGYTENDISNITSQNWIRFLKKYLPK
jgi:membrane dipeptidase